MENVMQRTLRDLMESSCKKYRENKFLYFIGGAGYTFGEFLNKSNEISSLLAEYGVRRGEKVGLVAQNMPNWTVAYFSVAAFGRIVVPMLPDFSESEVRHIIKHSGCKAIFVSERLLPKISEKSVERLDLIVRIDDFSVIKGEKTSEPERAPSPEEIDPDDLAAIIYTSGTTGSSKGVMLSHKNLCANLHSAQDLRPSYTWDVWLSILPLSHTLESSLCMLLPMLAGGSVYYMEKAPTPTMLLKAMSIVHPTTILSVPLIIEKVYKSSVLPAFNKNRMTKFLYSIPPFRKILNRIAGRKLIEKFGGKVRFFGIGGAKLDTNVEKFLIEARFPYAIGYGLTETSPLIAGAPPAMVRLGSTGPVITGVTVRLLNKDPETGIGEIAVKGDNVMKGYYLNPEATAEAFTPDGWFRTKDLGMFDKQGWLYIKGRASTTIIGPSGENIYPEEIESVINSHDLVSESIVTERKGKLIALVHFDAEKVKKWLVETTDEKKAELQEKKAEIHEKYEKLKKELLEYVNEKVSKFSRLSEIDEQEEEFEKTATKKIKRYLYNKSDETKKK